MFILRWQLPTANKPQIKGEEVKPIHPLTNMRNKHYTEGEKQMISSLIVTHNISISNSTASASNRLRSSNINT